ncbi:MAG: hypothetical protein CMJ27_05630 [Phycisphaerae bacterium]|nr:hypothetical protein [Phycisphaerae bacterium]OUX01962.1 MAG: hypothetical protein CBD91_03455 [Phycisphaeraceae bacterium TMED231]
MEPILETPDRVHDRLPRIPETETKHHGPLNASPTMRNPGILVVIPLDLCRRSTTDPGQINPVFGSEWTKYERIDDGIAYG